MARSLPAPMAAKVFRGPINKPVAPRLAGRAETRDPAQGRTDPLGTIFPNR